MCKFYWAQYHTSVVPAMVRLFGASLGNKEDPTYHHHPLKQRRFLQRNLERNYPKPLLYINCSLDLFAAL